MEFPRVPEEILRKKKHGKFRSYEIGYLHIDITEFYLEGRKWYLFVAIDRVSKICTAELFDNKTLKSTLVFLRRAIAFFPYKLHRILTDNGTQFTYRGMPENRRPNLFCKNGKNPLNCLTRTHITTVWD